MTTPNKDNLRLWVQALESSKYQQTRSALRKADAFCCLGVACDVYHKATGNGRWKQTHHYEHEFSVDGETRKGELPPPVAAWLGLPDTDPMLLDADGDEEHATYLNDNKRRSFKEIAKAIRRTFRIGVNNPTPTRE